MLALLILLQISCSSCDGNLCIRDKISQTKPQFNITLNCSDCNIYPKTISFSINDTKRSIELKQENFNQLQQSFSVSIANFFISDGEITLNIKDILSNYSISCTFIYDDFPKKVSNLEIFSSNKAIALSWNTYDRDIKSYTIYWGEGNKEMATGCTGNKAETTAESYTITELKNGVKYCGKIVAVDNGGKISEPVDFEETPQDITTFGKEVEIEGQKTGCIITYLFGENKATRKIREVKKFLIEHNLLPIVKLYYKISGIAINIIETIKEFFIKEAKAEKVEKGEGVKEKGKENGEKKFFRKFFSIGGGWTQYKNMPQIFKTAYGEKSAFGFLGGGVGIKFIGDINTKISTGLIIKGGKSVIKVQEGKETNFIGGEEGYTTLLIIPIEAQINYFLRFFEEQYLIPFGGISFENNLVFEFGRISPGFLSRVSGYSYSLGGLFLLDFIDRRSEKVMKEEFGIENTFLYFEYKPAKINLVKSGGKIFQKSNFWNFSSNIFIVGIHLEMK